MCLPKICTGQAAWGAAFSGAILARQAFSSILRFGVSRHATRQDCHFFTIFVRRQSPIDALENIYKIYVIVYPLIDNHATLADPARGLKSHLSRIGIATLADSS